MDEEQLNSFNEFERLVLDMIQNTMANYYKDLLNIPTEKNINIDFLYVIVEQPFEDDIFEPLDTQFKAFIEGNKLFNSAIIMIGMN